MTLLVKETNFILHDILKHMWIAKTKTIQLKDLEFTKEKTPTPKHNMNKITIAKLPKRL